MEFPQMLVTIEAWVDKRDTQFVVTSSDETECRVHLEIPDTEISFYVSTCDNSDGSKKWMIWSNNDTMLSYLVEVQEMTERCAGTYKPLQEILDKADKCLSSVLRVDEDSGEDEGADLDEDDVDDDYYNDPEAELDDAGAAPEQNIGGCNDSGEDEDIEDNFFFAQGSPAAVQRLTKDLKSLKKAGDSFGIEGNPRNDNLFLWDVKLKDFPTDSKLGKDLQKYADKYKREAVVYIEMHFPGEYPMKPPFVRILRPRFKFLTGHVTIGGSICMQLLTNSGWTPTNDIENILVQIRSEIMSDKNAQLEQSNPDTAYGEQEARDAFNRMVQRYNWGS